MKIKFLVLTALSLSLLATPACSNTPAAQPAPAPATSAEASSPASTPAGPADLTVADTSLGSVVVTADKMTAYIFTKDTANSGKSVCAGECLVKWPPIKVTADTPTVEGITGTVGSITLDDGTKQATINGLPLYTWINDKKPGDVTGQGVGEVWYVVGPDGKKIDKS
jgi:predicted lipoprotein with Yx(FWY)xxD motif